MKKSFDGAAPSFDPPPRVRRWELRGAGLENLHQAEIPLPKPGSDQLLVRHDAVGICFSDIKILAQGGNHVRLLGRDLETDPVVMGHEVSLTVVAAGENLREKFAPGQRFIMQADIWFKGANPCYGYQLSGGMSEYGLVTEEVLQGDEGCYLIPLQAETGYSEGAMVEPWACVVAAFEYGNYRDGLRDGGSLLVAASEDSDPDYRVVIGPGHEPAIVSTLVMTKEGDLLHSDSFEEPLGGYDDILVYGLPTRKAMEGLIRRMAKRGILNLVAPKPSIDALSLDLGRVHYEQLLFVWSPDSHGAADAYRSNRRAELLPGGKTWMIGSGGPMGQMHIGRVLSLEHPPRLLVVSDRHDDRLDLARERYAESAARKGIDLRFFNAARGERPEDFGPYDDIVSMVPSAPAIAQSLPYLAENGVYNLFAGVSRGVCAEIDLGAALLKNQRLIGTSGSSLSDIRHTLELTESKRLSTDLSVAAIGGLDAYRDGLQAVKEGRFPGKTVIYPHLIDLPLLSLPEVRQRFPAVGAAMHGDEWSASAERALFEAFAQEQNNAA